MQKEKTLLFHNRELHKGFIVQLLAWTHASIKILLQKLVYLSNKLSYFTTVNYSMLANPVTAGSFQYFTEPP